MNATLQLSIAVQYSYRLYNSERSLSSARVEPKLLLVGGKGREGE